MAAVNHLNQILFHASLSTTPPHEGDSMVYGQRFHLGTLAAAVDRINYSNFTDDALRDFTEEPEVPEIKAYMHVYDVSVPKDLHVYHDPHGSGYDEYVHDDWDPDKAVDEKKVGDIAAYENLHEDPGSVSYVVHKNMLTDGRVKFVGTMPFTARAEEGDRWRIQKELGYD
jgi:hypothetical protein